MRFQVVFWLTSSTNASYLHVSTVKVRSSHHVPLGIGFYPIMMHQ